MIKRIIACGFLLCLFVAIPLALMGIEKVELGSPFLAFLKNCNRELNDFKIEIPNVPHIPNLDVQNDFLAFVNVVINFINGLVNVINFVVMFFNVIISVLQFLFILIKNLITFKDMLLTNPIV